MMLQLSCSKPCSLLKEMIGFLFKNLKMIMCHCSEASQMCVLQKESRCCFSHKNAWSFITCRLPQRIRKHWNFFSPARSALLFVTYAFSDVIRFPLNLQMYILHDGRRRSATVEAIELSSSLAKKYFCKVANMYTHCQTTNRLLVICIYTSACFSTSSFA